MKTWLVLITAFLFALTPPCCCHTSDYPRPTPEDLKKVEPPLEGAPAFATRLAEQAGTLLTEPQLAILNRAITHYGYMENIQLFRYPDIQAGDDKYHCWRGDQALTELVEAGVADRVFDFSPGAEPEELHQTVPFDVNSQYLCWEVRMGSGPLRFVTRDFDLRPERYSQHLTLTVPQPGTSCFLIRLQNVPTTPATVIFQFQKEGASNAFSWHSLTLEPQQPGQLSLAVLEHGEEVPAMVRLQSLPSGALWAPQGALDFRSQLHEITESASPPMLNIYGPSGSFELRVPGHTQVTTGLFPLVSKWHSLRASGKLRSGVASRRYRFNAW